MRPISPMADVEDGISAWGGGSLASGGGSDGGGSGCPSEEGDLGTGWAGASGHRQPYWTTAASSRSGHVAVPPAVPPAVPTVVPGASFGMGRTPGSGHSVGGAGGGGTGSYAGGAHRGSHQAPAPPMPLSSAGRTGHVGPPPAVSASGGMPGPALEGGSRVQRAQRYERQRRLQLEVAAAARHASPRRRLGPSNTRRHRNPGSRRGGDGGGDGDGGGNERQDRWRQEGAVGQGLPCSVDLSVGGPVSTPTHSNLLTIAASSYVPVYVASCSSFLSVVVGTFSTRT